MHATTRLYLQDDHRSEIDATVVAVRENSLAFDQTCFYPGGGGQPPDEGSVRLESGQTLEIPSVHADTDGIVWHLGTSPPPADILGQPATLILDRGRRLALTRYHTVLHVLNTVALRDYAGWITGVQIGTEYSRIDFKLEGFSAALCGELEAKVNAVLAGNHALRSYYLSEAEFRARDDLRRTLEVKPPLSVDCSAGTIGTPLLQPCWRSGEPFVNRKNTFAPGSITARDLVACVVQEETDRQGEYRAGLNRLPSDATTAA